MINSVFTRDSSGGLTLASYQKPGETWRWAVSWQWKRWRDAAKNGRSFVCRATHRSGQWHDEYGPLMISRQDYHLERIIPAVGDVLEWQCSRFPNVNARWRVVGCFYGGTGQESLIEMECLTHSPGWTGEWEYHPRVFVPEQLTRTLTRVVKGKNHDLR